jgi:serine/threonine-protein kinase
MLVGQTLGPFAIDRELGSGAMGAVYRGRYVKTGQTVAIKVMAPGIGSTNANAAARFEREAAILKQFNHPNIVRLFGVGKSHGTRYYAMEYIEGESLDRVMARRGRMSWDEVVTLGQQLCAALHHAHQQGVVHRDLKPSNLMILKDGTLKLTDFGIAKDLDVTRLTSANCTVGTAAYMSPEQCRGDPDLTHKSDLYSLGVVFYELITGQKPFQAENAMDMFMQHVQGTFERPSRLVPDMPIWLDTLICQLLEKQPDHRPLDASTIYAALGRIQEKVEARLSAGVEAAKRRVIDRAPGTERPDETDREMARTLLTGKGRRKRRKNRQKFYEKGWFVITGLLALIAGVVAVLFLVLGPPAPEKLREQAKTLLESSNHEDHVAALEGPIKTYLASYSNRPGPQLDEIRQWKEDVQAEQCEDILERYASKRGAAIKFESQNETEKIAFKAVDDESEGRLENARSGWESIQKSHGNDEWGITASRRLGLLAEVDNVEKRWNTILEEVRIRGLEPELDSLDRDVLRGFRAEHFGDLYQEPRDNDIDLAQRIYKELKDNSQKTFMRRAVLLFAAKKADKLKAASDSTKAAEDRKAAVTRALATAKAIMNNNDREARLIAMNVVALYLDKDFSELEALVADARKLVHQINENQGVKER